MKFTIKFLWSPKKDMKFDKVYNKSIEELMELSTVLVQQQNKQTSKDYTENIEEEIADVYVWLDELKKRFDSKKIDARMIEKRKKYNL